MSPICIQATEIPKNDVLTEISAIEKVLAEVLPTRHTYLGLSVQWYGLWIKELCTVQHFPKISRVYLSEYASFKKSDQLPSPLTDVSVVYKLNCPGCPGGTRELNA